jgi:hypothetical protein
MTTTKDITIVFDNGGGITLQVGEGDDRYQHAYDNADHCAIDIRRLLAGESTYGWDGNEAGNWMELTAEEFYNGDYKIMDAEDVIDFNPDSTDWHNLRELHAALAN